MVAGGIALLAALGLAAVFVLRRRRRDTHTMRQFQELVKQNSVSEGQVSLLERRPSSYMLLLGFYHRPRRFDCRRRPAT